MKEKLICGIDDSGRGPVIGPMVLAGVLIEESKEKKLKELGAKDSKLLTRKKRDKIAEEIKKITKYDIRIVLPKEIDEKIMSGTNLNSLEGEKAVEIINKLNPDIAYLDCPSPNLKAWKNFIYERLKNKNVELIVEHKADKNFPVVSAASVLAKNTRDKEVDKIKKIVKVDFKSGYSHDPETIKFLKENIDKYPEFFRKSWMTFKNHKNAKKQKNLEEYQK